MVFDIRKIFKIRRKKFVFSAENMLSESALKFPLIKYAQKVKFEKKFSRIRKLDLDMIWDHDRYVKASPGSTLHNPNNGLAICDDLGRKSGIF